MWLNFVAFSQPFYAKRLECWLVATFLRLNMKFESCGWFYNETYTHKSVLKKCHNNKFDIFAWHEKKYLKIWSMFSFIRLSNKLTLYDVLHLFIFILGFCHNDLNEVAIFGNDADTKLGQLWSIYLKHIFLNLI